MQRSRTTGTRIAGRVRGQGPPLVLVHGALSDGEGAWRFLLPFLVDHFTCYQLSTRGRGLSGDNADHSSERHFEDVAAYVRSVGEPVGMFGHSSGACWALGAAARAPEHVRAVAVYEPPLPGTEPLIPNEDLFARMSAAVGEGRLAAAVRLAVSEAIGLDEREQALFSTPPGSEIAEANIRVAVDEIREILRPLDDVVVERLTMPVLVVQGALSGAHFKEATRHLIERIDHGRLVEVAGTGHMGPVTAPEAVSQELVRFFNDP